jgi:hypothetical protein
MFSVELQTFRRRWRACAPAASLDKNSGFAPADEMNYQENHRKQKQQVNQRSRHMEHHERSNPREKQ